MTTLTGTTPANTYKDLLQVSNTNQGIDATLRPVSDGEGTESPLQLSATEVNIESGFALGGTPVPADILALLVAADYAAARTLLELPIEIGIACSDGVSNLTTGTAKVTFRAPRAFTLDAVLANVSTAPTDANIVVDLNKNGSSILSTKLSIDATEKTSATAATPAVISDATVAQDDEFTIDIDAVGSTIPGVGLKVWLLGTRA